MMEMRDCKNYDVLTLYVKKKKLAEIIEYYDAFGWKVVKQQDNERYEDIVDLSFSRPHKIDNKDELQLQQVYMEEKLNEIGKIEKYKHSKTLICGLNLGLIVLAVISMGIFLMISKFFVLGGICVAVGVVMIVLEVFLLRKLNKKQKLIYNNKHQQLEDEIDAIISNVKRLTGGKDEK